MAVSHHIKEKYGLDGVIWFHWQIALHEIAQNLTRKVLLVKSSISLIHKVDNLYHFLTSFLIDSVEIVIHVLDQFEEATDVEIGIIDDSKAF